MIRGRIGQNRQPRLTVQIADANGTLHPVEFILDTGYNGWLTLPHDLISQLGLTIRRTRTVSLADGRSVVLRTFTATVLWHGQPSNVYVIESESEPLLGMSMLWGSKLTLEAQEGGEVTIEEIHPTTE